MTEEKGKAARVKELEGEEQERGRRESGGSTGNVDLMKRKREEIESEKWAFNRSKKVQRSPQKEGKEITGDERSWIEEIKNEVKAEMREGIKEMVEIMREQGREIRQEVEDLRRIMEEREKKWMKEKEEMEEKIRELEKTVTKRKEEGIENEEDTREKGLERKLKEIDKKLEMRERGKKKKHSYEEQKERGTK